MASSEVSLHQIAKETNLNQELHPLVPHNVPPNAKYSFSMIKLLIILFIVAVCSCCLANIDRIINYFEMLSSTDSTNLILKYDLVIVGGGISGLSNMHFQSINDEKKQILLVEKLDRIGGRAISYNINYFNHNIVIELGAMRTAQNDYYTNRMIKRLNLCDDMIPFTPTGVDRMFYYKNTMSTGYDNVTINNYWNNLYEFTERDIYLLNQENIFENIFNAILLENNNGNSPNSDDEWYDFRNNWTLDGILIKDYSYKIFYEHYLNSSIEFWNYQYATSFYFHYDQSMLEQIYNRYGPVEKYSNSSATPGTNQMYTLKNGYNDITWKLFDNASSYQNNHFLFNEKVINIDYSSISTNGDKYRYLITIENTMNKTKKYIETDKIILAMDAASIKNNIVFFKPIYNADTVQFINSNVQSSNYKVNMIYMVHKTNISELTFFNKLYNIQGLSTDLSVKTIVIPDYSVSENHDSILFAVQLYSTLDYRTRILHQLQEIGSNDLYIMDENINLENNPNNINNLLISSKLIVNHIKKQLSVLIDIDIQNIPNPLCSFSQPFGLNQSNVGGVTLWKYGIDHIVAMDRLFKPNENEEIFISSADMMYDHGIYHDSGILSAIQILIKYFEADDPFIDQESC